MLNSEIIFNLINQQPDIHNIYLYTKDPQEAKSQFLIKKREITGLNHFNVSKAFIENSDGIDDTSCLIQIKNVNHQSLLIVWLLICLVIKNLIINPLVTQLFIRHTKVNISLAFVK